ncbi:MAG: DoxX family protein [Halanaeroarchaeum sp.]
MTRDAVHLSVLGHETVVPYSQRWAGYALVAMRMSVGWVLFDAGLRRITSPTWTPATLFHGVSPANPLSGAFATVGQAAGWFLGPLLIWGLALAGGTLIFGAAVRASAVVGALVMGVFWLAELPLDGAVIVDHHLVYALVLFGLGAFGAGRIVGLDAYFEHHRLLDRFPVVRYLLG